MLGYRFTPEALRDMAGIVSFLHKKVSSHRSMLVEKALWAGCAEIVRFPGLGHVRQDLTSKNLLFYMVDRYYLIFERTPADVLVHAVIHGARDVPTILRRRKL
jgi:plasmid stabilization system protein ParE